MPRQADPTQATQDPQVSVPISEFLTPNLGKRVYGDPVVVDRERAIAFSDAINDPIAEHAAGTSVTPMFSVVPIYSCMFDAVDMVTPEDLRSMILHGAHDIRFNAPVRVGSTLQARAQVTGVHAVSIGTAVTVHIDVTDENGASISNQVATALVRGAAAARDEGAGAPEVSLSGQHAAGPDGVAPPRRMTSELRPDQTTRFSRASGDMNSVHLDGDVARALGFDGVILHGLCTLGIASGAVIAVCCDQDPPRLRRLAVRFAAPAYPQGELTSELTSLGGGRYGLTAVTSNGVPVIKRGLVEAAAD